MHLPNGEILIKHTFLLLFISSLCEFLSTSLSCSQIQFLSQNLQERTKVFPTKGTTEKAMLLL